MTQPPTLPTNPYDFEPERSPSTSSGSTPYTRPIAERSSDYSQQEIIIHDPQANPIAPYAQNYPAPPVQAAPGVYPYPVYDVAVRSNEERYTDAPIHPLAALIMIVMDWLWGLGEAGGTATVVGVVAVPVLMACTAGTSFFATLFVQKFVARDGWGTAFAKAVVTGIIAGVPFPVAGTAFGAALLAWAGIGALGRRR